MKANLTKDEILLGSLFVLAGMFTEYEDTACLQVKDLREKVEKMPEEDRTDFLTMCSPEQRLILERAKLSKYGARRIWSHGALMLGIEADECPTLDGVFQALLSLHAQMDPTTCEHIAIAWEAIQAEKDLSRSSEPVT